MTQEITYASPTPLLEDMGVFIDYLETHDVEVNPSGAIAGKNMIELNALLHFTVQDVTVRVQERFMPFIFMMKMLGLNGDLFAVEARAKGKPLLKPTARLEEFKLLSPAEQYFFLLETFWVESNWNEMTELMQGTRGAVGFWNLFEASVLKQVSPNVDIRTLRGFYAWYSEPMVQFGEFFGWWRIEQINKEQRQKNSMTRAFWAESLFFTDFGYEIANVLSVQRSPFRWNKAERERLFPGGHNRPGSPLPKTFPRNDNFFFPAQEIPKAVIHAPFKNNEQFFEAFKHLVPAGTLTKTLVQKTVESVPARIGTYSFKISLSGSIWRRIGLAPQHTLDDLHNAIQTAFKFDNDHLYAFFMNGKAWSQAGTTYWSPHNDEGPFANKAVVSTIKLLPKQKFLYLFDYGDEWRFDVVFEGVDESLPPPKKAVVLETKGKAPKQYGYDDDDDDGKEIHDNDKNNSVGSSGDVVPVSAFEKGVQIQSFNVTWDALPPGERDEPPTPPEVQYLVDEVPKKITAKANLQPQITQLLAFKKQYPDIPMVYNLLRNAYAAMKQDNERQAIDTECYERFPQYLFAKIHYAEQFLASDPARAKAVFGDVFNLALLYPKRTMFHISEVMAFAFFAVRYYVVMKDMDNARFWAELMETLDENDPLARAAATMVEQSAEIFSIANALQSMISKPRAVRAVTKSKQLEKKPVKKSGK
jgi:Plasmid pRiA4b ORF-3-like protein